MNVSYQKKSVLLGLALAVAACDSGNEGGISASAANGSGMTAADTGGNDTSMPGDSGTPQTTGESADGSTGGGAGDETGGTPPGDVPCVSLIDDFEGGNSLIPTTDDRSGAWYIYVDDSEGVLEPADLQPPTCAPYVPTREIGRDGSLGAMLKGTGFAEFAALGVDINNAGYEPDPENPCVVDYSTRMTYDVSQYQGVTFYAKSNAGRMNLRLKVPTTDEIPVEEGGTCTVEEGDKKCADSFGKIAPIGEDWTAVQISFDELIQEGWGQKLEAWDPTKVVGLQFQTNSMVWPDFDFVIDDVCFY